MDIVNKVLNPEQFRKYVQSKFFGFLPANKIVLHHTVHPLPEQWRGERTILALKTYYENKGWSAGPHLFIAPDGIWLFTDMRKNGIHAGSGNWRSIGIEMVGNFDKVKPEGIIWYYTKYAISVLNDKLNLLPENIKFHRDFSEKSCPGLAVTKNWVIEEVKMFSVFPNGTFLKVEDNPNIYYIWENCKYHIPDMATLKFYWGVFGVNFKTVSKYEFNKIKEGKSLPSIKNL